MTDTKEKKEARAQRDEIKRIRAALRKESAKYPSDKVVEVPEEFWPDSRGSKPFKVWRSKDFLVMLYQEANQIVRMTVARADIDDEGRWRDDISWDELFMIKGATGYKDHDAIEIHPAIRDYVNVANMRHLWILPEGREVECKWRSETGNENIIPIGI